MSNHIDPGHYPKLIGARLRELREARGLTCVGLSRLARVSRQSVSATELARGCCPTLNTLAQYAQALNVDILDILSCLKPSPSVDAAPAKTDGISGTSQPARSNPPVLAAARHLTLDAPFGLQDVRVAAAECAREIECWPAWKQALSEPSAVRAHKDVQTPGGIVGVPSVCSDSHGSEAINHGIALVAVDLAAWSPCS